MSTARLVALFALLGGCSVGGDGPLLADAGPLDAAGFVERDAGSQPDEAWDCDPFSNGVFVAAVEYDGAIPSRTLSRFDPPSATLSPVADIRSCVDGWYIRSMAVQRDGVVHFVLGDQTLASYRLSDGECTKRPLPRHEDDGLYQLVGLVGDPAAPRRERLVVAFAPWGLEGYELIELDEASFEERSLGVFPTDGATLVSLAGTPDGRLLATRSRGGAEDRRVDLVALHEAPSMTSLVLVPFRSETWFRSAVVLWDRRVFVFDATDGTQTVRSAASEVDLEAGAWSDPLWSADALQVEAVATTTCLTLI